MNDKIAEFAAYLRAREKTAATVTKYVRDVRAMLGICGDELTREAVLAYKSHLTQRYAVRSVNSKIASLNSFFDFLGREELKLRSLKMQREVYCEEIRDLTREEYLVFTPPACPYACGTA